MENMFGNETVSIFYMVRENAAGKTVCRVCGAEVRELYATDRGYVCKEHK